MFSSFFHFWLYPTPRISYIAVPRFMCLNRSNRNYKLLSKSNVMEISYEIQEKQELESVQMGGGCYTKCEVNVDYGADYWCCERIKSA